MSFKKIFPKLRRPSAKVVAARILVILLMLSNLTFIWINSSKTAKDSTEVSESVTESVAPHVIDGYKEMTKPQKEVKIKELNPKIRSVAHMLEYIPLGILLFFLMLSVFDICRKSKTKHILSLIALSIVLALLFALTDETHQLYVDGRSFEIKDIGLDMLGMTIGYILSFITVLGITSMKSEQ